jgi:hypothetical protein
VIHQKIQHAPRADRAAHDGGPVETEPFHHGQHRRHVALRREAVLLILKILGRRRLAVPGQIEHDDTETLRHLAVVQKAAILPAVGARGVQTQQRNPEARVLKVNAMAHAADLEMDIAADDRFDRGRHSRASPLKMAPTTPLTKNRWRKNGSASPSNCAFPASIIATTSL